MAFPQWQGSGKRKYVYEGAQLICGMLPAGTEYATVPVGLDEELSEEHGIIGYRQIVSQLSAACDMIRGAMPDKIFLIGGDCGTSVAPVSYLNRRHGGDLAVLWLDAHGDLNSPATSVTGNFHGMPLRCLLGDGDEALVGRCFSTLRPEQVIMGGTRELDPPEAEFIREHRISALTVDDLAGDEDAVSRLVEAKGYRSLYVHIDVDVLDSEKCPWALCRTPDGLDTGALLALLRRLKARHNLCGISLVEVRPVENMDLAPLRELVNTCREI